MIGMLFVVFCWCRIGVVMFIVVMLFGMVGVGVMKFIMDVWVGGGMWVVYGIIICSVWLVYWFMFLRNIMMMCWWFMC